MIKLCVVILTGSRTSKSKLLEGTSIHNKVLLPIEGKPMVEYVIEAASQSSFEPRIYVSTEDPDVLSLRKRLPFEILPTETTAVDSFLKSLERVPKEAEWVLLISGDHPLLTPEMIDYFIHEAVERALTFAVAAVNRNIVRRQYPESQRTYFPVSNGAYSGGNLFLIHKERFHANSAVLQMVDRNRKQPWRSIPVLGLKTILETLFRRLDIHEIARRSSAVIGCETGIVDMPFPECCMDVDKPSDKVIAEKIIRRRRQQPSRTFAIQQLL